MGFSKSFKKIAKAVVNPVGAGIEKLTGISQADQFKVGAGVGAGVGIYGLGRGVLGALSNAAPIGPRYPDGSFNAGDVGRQSNGPMTNFNPWSFLAPAIGAGADIWSANKIAAGQQEANQTNLQSARENMAFQAAQVGQQQAFQTEMSNTAHQREVADLKAAGLNPVLSANSGASTPVGSSGSGAQSNVQNAAPDYKNVIPKGIDTAVRLKQMQKDFETADSGIYLNAAAAAREEANAKVARHSARKVSSEADMSKMVTDYAKKHPWVFKSGQWIKAFSPFATSAQSLGSAVK